MVRDRKGRFVTNLSKKDFKVAEAGQPRDIVDFRAEVNGPVKVAVLMDVSGSMRMAQRTTAGGTSALVLGLVILLGAAHYAWRPAGGSH